MNNSVCINAYAKINLTLEILNRLPDGFHEIRSVMQQVELHDDIIIHQRQDRKIILHCDVPKIPLDGNNIVWKTVELVRQRSGVHHGVEIFIAKRIPVAGGLAGGSSDAATTIRGLNKLWELNLSQDQMTNLGEQLGMDVPYCLIGGTAFVSGKGQIIKPLPSLPEQQVVIANPGTSMSTHVAYKALDEIIDWSKHNQYIGTNTADLIKVIENGKTSEISKHLYNDFEKIIRPRIPMVSKIIETMLSCGAKVALLSGSGPSVYCLVSTQDHAKLVVAGLQEFTPFAVVTSTVTNQKQFLDE